MNSRVLAATVVALSCPAAIGCGGIGSSPTPTSVVMVDASGSTKNLQGEFKPAITDAIIKTAENEGQLWAAGGDNAVLANAVWNIDGKKFTAPSEGEALKVEDLKLMGKQAANSPEAKKLLLRTNRQGSDLVGLLKMAGDVFSAHPDGTRSLLFLTDGGINEMGVDLFTNPPRDSAAGEKVIQTFVDKGLIAKGSLSGPKGKPVKVWLCGVGRGAAGNGGLTALYVQNFWKQLITFAGGEVVSEAPSCSSLGGFASS